MEAIYTPKRTVDSVNVFLIGNNPIELSNIYVMLKAIRKIKFNAEIGFDLPGIYERILKFKPKCIVIDDNIEQIYLKKLLNKLSSGSKTKDIPVTIIKNNNYSKDSFSGVHDFLLKENITSELLSNTIINAIRLRKVHSFFHNSVKSTKNLVLHFF